VSNPHYQYHQHIVEQSIDDPPVAKAQPISGISFERFDVGSDPFRRLDGGPMRTSKILSSRRRAGPMAELGPGLRREDKEESIVLNHPNESKH
jgi:hypothetical protein